MAWLHAWMGVVVGWLLFFVFVTGTAGYFAFEIDRWMRPELPLPAAPAPPTQALSLAQAHLTQRAPGADLWQISLQGRREQHLTVSWRDQAQPGEEVGRRNDHFEALDPAIGAVTRPRETGGGSLLYRMHYQLHYFSYDTAVLIVGFCSMLMLVGIVSGVITHKKIFKDFFTFRPARGQRSWLDAHNVIGVAALPFFIMITYSGLAFFMFEYVPGGVTAVYGSGGKEALYEELEPGSRLPERSGQRVPLQPLTKMLTTAEQVWGANSVQNVRVQWPGDAHARVRMYRPDDSSLFVRSEFLMFDGVSGEILDVSKKSSIETTRGVIFALHEGRFAGVVLRWLYFSAGLLGAAMIGTGLVLWTVKRRLRQHKSGKPAFGHTLIEQLNVGTLAGLPIAIAAYFWANRLIPLDTASRADWEAHVLFIMWGLMFLHAFCRPLRCAWVEQLWLAASALGMLPLLNVLTTDRHLGVTLSHSDWMLASIDLTMLGLGALFAYAAFKVQRQERLASQRIRPVATAVE